jgi:hypothetical protein
MWVGDLADPEQMYPSNNLGSRCSGEFQVEIEVGGKRPEQYSCNNPLLNISYPVVDAHWLHSNLACCNNGRACKANTQEDYLLYIHDTYYYDIRFDGTV